MPVIQKRKEFRTFKLETRAETQQESGKKLVLRGYPILFNTETVIFDDCYGEVGETILPTALDGVDLSDVYLVSGHNIEPDKVLGRSGRNMRLEVDSTGLFMECQLPNTQCARDIYNLIEAGLVDGMSFGFDCYDEINPETLKRTITHIDKLYEITITPFPAYKEASVIVQDEMAQKEQKEKEEQDKLEQEQKQLEEDQKKLEEDQEKYAKELEDLLDE